MSHLSDNDHDLEDHLEQLKKLDSVRKRSAEFRDEGIDVLLESLFPPDNDKDFPCSKERRYEISLILRALLVFHNQPHRDTKKESKRVKLVDALLTQLEEVDLNELVDTELSVLLAASMLRTLTALPSAACSKVSILCYYWIVLEIYTANSSDWQIGGARAAPGGVATAYTTGECVRALLSFKLAIHNTGKFIGIVGHYLKRYDHLENLINPFSDEASGPLLKLWIDNEKDRLQVTTILKLQKLAHYHLFPLDFLNEEHPEQEIKNYLDRLIKKYVLRMETVADKSKLEEIVEKFESEPITKKNDCQVLIVSSLNCPDSMTVTWFDDKGKFTRKDIDNQHGELLEELKNDTTNERKIIEQIKSELGCALKEVSFIDDFKNDVNTVVGKYSKAIDEIKEYREKLPKDNEYTRSLSPHEIAFNAVEDAEKRLEKVLRFSEQSNDHVYTEIEEWFYETAEEIKKILHPVKIYLSSVLDRELGLISRGEAWDWKASELACAAASYRRLIDSKKKDVRFRLAADELRKVISSRGTFASHLLIHHFEDGGKYMLSNEVNLHSLSQLLCYAYDKEIDPDLIKNMLNYFEDTRAHRPLETWGFETQDISVELVRHLKTETGITTLIVEKSTEMKEILHKIPNHAIDSLPKPIVQAIRKEIANALNTLIRREPLFPELKDIESFKRFKDSEFARKLNDDLLVKKLEQNNQLKQLLKKYPLERARQYKVNKLFLQIVFTKQMFWFTVAHRWSDKTGWGGEFSPSPIKTSLIETAGAVIALAEMNTMLDEQINKIIFEHFSIKKAGEGLNENLTLDTLFYTDYGLSLAPTLEKLNIDYSNIDNSDQIKGNAGIQQKKSVAISLQQMHAHINRLVLPDEVDESLYSMVLHGPPGTGKTTLVEALAVTSGVPLIEITPSDLVKGGQENIERRARAVFYALSLLTRVVILFDEFDPVLRRRDVTNDNPLNVFSFLTPGMLPKLKDLHDRAEERSVVYVLITNHIGGLDEAAIRKGRFDERIGIYPPDLLSRTGRLLDQFYTYNKQLTDDEKNLNKQGLVSVISDSANMGMTTLGKPGWFTCPKGNVKLKTPFNLLLAKNDEINNEENKIDWPAAEAECKGILGKGPIATKEYLQWNWIDLWDSAFKDKKTFKVVKNGLTPKYAQNSREPLKVKIIEK